VTRTGPANLIATTTATVQFATAGGTATPGMSGAADYVATTQILTFSPGQTSKSVSIPLTGDFTLEPDEVTLSLTNPNDAVLGAEHGHADHRERRSGGRDRVRTVDVPRGRKRGDRDDHTPADRRPGGRVTALVSTLTTGTATTADYTPFTNKVVTFAGGATASFTIAINNDTLAEADETVVMQISSVSARPPSTPTRTPRR
jgi:hypothetical protein